VSFAKEAARAFNLAHGELVLTYDKKPAIEPHFAPQA